MEETAYAKINLALHVRGRLLDGRHELDTVFAFCVDGDMVAAEVADEVTLEVGGPFAAGLSGDNLVLTAAHALREAAKVGQGAALRLVKNLPVASGIGGGSADAAAALRLLTRLWGIDPAHATAVAPGLGSDVPACLLSMSARGTGAGDRLELLADSTIAGSPVLLVNPLEPLSTRAVFAGWDGEDRGPLGDWRDGRNDLEQPARALVPAIGDVLQWLDSRPGATLARMSGSGATCFALFDREADRDSAAAACPDDWWHLASFLR
jgi:4-diphosphocytidyl-2-C-methyl-D-erythritol kinase